MLKLSEHLAAGKAFDLTSLQLDRYGFRGDIEDLPAVLAWLKAHPLVDFPVHDEVRVMSARPDQSEFRRRVLEAWSGRCAISGCNEPKVLEAAHLGGRGAWRNQNAAVDGILLRVDLHRLFEAGLLTIEPDGTVRCGVAGYEQFDGEKIDAFSGAPTP